MSLTWLESEQLFKTAVKNIVPVNILLDIGCGIQPSKFIRPMVHICCEPFVDYVVFLQNKILDENDRSYVIINATWSNAVELFPAKSVDTVFLIDVIEHLEKEEALSLLKRTENIARKQIVVFTPLGFMPQSHPDGIDAWGLNGGAWQEHKSGWQPDDFDKTWEIFASKTFHKTDSMGKELETPFGALFALKTFDSSKSNVDLAHYYRQKAHSLVERLFSIARKVGLVSQ